MTDILLNKTGDLLIQNGDIVIGYSDNQHQEDILLASKGDYKEFPELGVGISNMLNEDDFMPFLIEAKKNLEYDGMIINNLKFEENGNLNIDGYYK
ncbi:oxidase [Flavobacterium sp. LC2016-23]|uniref:oxidase n=1 Tax=Flavobacterium sp. LC2016-23 TaxID=2666330 RepID=UPI0012B1024F|nr:oxidase [Flavobacterium sp. LC2016-23]MRX40396.1 oxidase [Flavobacterium sp. LC2016-23]